MSATTATVMTFQLSGAAGDKLLVLNTFKQYDLKTDVSEGVFRLTIVWQTDLYSDISINMAPCLI